MGGRVMGVLFEVMRIGPAKNVKTTVASRGKNLATVDEIGEDAAE